MQLSHNTWLLFLVIIFHPPGYIAVSQSFSSNCLNMKSIVNCSHRGIVFEIEDYSNNTSCFKCSVCCDRWSCCEIGWNISLAIVNTTKTGNITFDAHNAKYSITSVTNPESDNFRSTNINNNLHCDNSAVLHGMELNTFSGFNGSYNYLTECPCLDEWSSLEWIDLSNNRISLIIRSFGNYPLLQTLYLKNNDITVILPDVFNGFPSLKYLHLNDNPSIEYWGFLNAATNLNIADIKGSCSKVHNIFRVACTGNNITLITDNTSCIQDIANCTLLPTWPTKPGTVLSLVPCLESNSKQSYTTIAGTDASATQDEDDHEIVIKTSFCGSFNWNLLFLASGNNCIWVSVSGVTTLVCVGVLAVALLRWRMRIKRQGRYTRWMSVYSRKSSEKCTRHPPSVELPAVPVAFNVSECSREADVYSVCYYYTIKENATSGKIFPEKDVCIMVNLKTGPIYNRWMGTINLSDEHPKCVVFSAVTGVASQNKTVLWDTFVKRALQLPKNKHLTNIEGMSIHQQTIYLVQEYLNCETLEARLKAKDGMDSSKTSTALTMMTSEVIRLILGILEGLELLHSYGFLHPGLSPKKVLLTNEGICKLYDFCLDEDAGKIVKMKKSHMVCDINQFAPEALLRDEYTKASDVWSTAVLVWKILSESYPFSFDAQTISEDELFPDPPSTWPDRYEALSNNKLFECWRVDSFLRPTIPELRSSFTQILEALITESSENVSKDSNDEYVPMHKIGDGEKTVVAFAQ